LSAAVASLAVRSLPLQAAGTVSLTALGSAYTQDFNTLASSGTSSVVPAGWDFSETGTNANTSYAAGTGSSNAGDTYSFGANGNPERAFGGLLSGSLVPAIGAQFTNDTGGTITSLAISYTGEMWRAGVTNRNAADRLDFQLSTNATSLATGTWTDHDGLDFSSPSINVTAGLRDGNAAPNRTVVSFTISGLSIANGSSFWIRWTDFNISSSDDGLAVDDFSITPAGEIEADTAPAVSSTLPVNGAVGIALNADVTVTFSEPVDLASAWFTLGCSLSGAKAAVVSGGPTSYTVNPDSDFENGDVCTLTIAAAHVTDRDAVDPPDAMGSDFTMSFSAGDPCARVFTPTYSIQGSGLAAAITGVVTTRGVVVGDYEYPGSGSTSGFLRGFYVQDESGDGNATTSDGLFVFNGNSDSVSVGDVVYVTGTAGEFQDQTQLSNVTSLFRCGSGPVTPVDVVFPVESPTFLERYEGMLVRLPQTMYVTEHFQLGRFGEVVISSGGRLVQPTQVALPGAPALAQQAANDLNRILVDDASQAQNPDPIVFARDGLPLSAANTLRGGDAVTGLTGVMTYTWAGNATSGNAYRVRPLNALGGSALFQAANPRPAAPPRVAGTLRVAGANLFNYFNTFDGIPDNVDNCAFGVEGEAADCRGADTAAEFDRQWPKTVAALAGTGADILGLIEIENDGYGPGSAIQDLVDRLNAATAPNTWAFIDADASTGQANALGRDAIKVGILYDTRAVQPVGDTAVLNTGLFGPFTLTNGETRQRNRPPLAQTFEDATGARLTVVVNHLSSKGSTTCADNASPIGADPDIGDGQGACNLTRLYAAEQLAAWLATGPTGAGDPDYLLLGDFNAYAREDPIRALEDTGLINLVPAFGGLDTYSYAFGAQWGSLDHALVSPSLRGQIAGASALHINADEPTVLDYNTNFKTANLQSTLYAADPFRAADHDPLLVDIALRNDAPFVSIGGPYTVYEGQTVELHANGYDPDGTAVTFDWDLDNDGSFETPGQNVTYWADNGVGTFTVRVRVTDATAVAAVASTTVTVLFNWAGFFAPVDNAPIWNLERAGRAVPVKFTLGGDKGLEILEVGYPVSWQVECPTGAPVAGGEPTATPGASTLSYDALSGEYTYVWKTDRTWTGTCRHLVVKLVDGSTHEALFKFSR
jgi:predicted extracellular nuclease